MTRPSSPEIRRIIESHLRGAGIHPGTCVRAACLRAADNTTDDKPAAGDEALDWTLSTELPATVFDWDRYDFVSEVLLADGMRVPASGQVPLLDSHNRQSALDVLGHVRDFAEIKAGEYPGRSGQVRFAADEKSQVVRQKIIDGHITDGSVGYQVTKSLWIQEGMTIAINGRNFTGPLKVSSEWSLKEFSITPIGADVLAKVRRLCGGL
jgi:hypothetical protein